MRLERPPTELFAYHGYEAAKYRSDKAALRAERIADFTPPTQEQVDACLRDRQTRDGNHVAGGREADDSKGESTIGEAGQVPRWDGREDGSRDHGSDGG